MSDPIDHLVAIAANWQRACLSYISDQGQFLANSEYLKWKTNNCQNTPSTADQEIEALRKQETARILSTDGAYAVRLLYGYERQITKAYFKESDITKGLLVALKTPENNTRTMIRLLTALTRFGILDRSPGVRGRGTIVRISDRGISLYEEFCLMPTNTTLQIETVPSKVSFYHVN